MSTCPEKDIHSIYLDNELPAAYVADYEAHVESCPKCKAQLEKLKMLRKVFSADSKSMELSEKDMEESFDRLQARLSYSRHAKKEDNVISFSPKKVVYALAGAAAALAVFVIPSRMLNKSAPVEQLAAQIPQVQLATKVSYPSNVPIHMDGEISPESLGNLFADGEVVDTDVGIGSLRTQIGTMGYANPGITTVGLTPGAMTNSGMSNAALTGQMPNTMVFKINGQDAFVIQPIINQVLAGQGQENPQDKNTFSVELSFGQFYLGDEK